MIAARTASLVRGAWRALSWRGAVGVAVMALVWSTVIVATQTGYFTDHLPLTPTLNAVLSMQLNGFAVLFAVLIADEASPPSNPRWWPYALAVPAGVAIGTTALWLVAQRVLHFATVLQMRGAGDGFWTYIVRHGWHALVMCGLVAFLYAAHRRGAQRTARLRDIQRNRVEAERALVEARLSAARARLEPQFLLRTLGDVESLYARDARLADHLLKELTAYLRASIPEMREPSSTVATEIRLASAFLNVSALRSRERLRLTAGEALSHLARMPPMVLLPLAQYALGVQPAGLLTLELARVGDRVVLTIRTGGQQFAPRRAEEPTLCEVRDRLQALHGANARLTLQDDSPGTAVAIEFPLEAAPDYGSLDSSSPRVPEHVRP